jgi:23S rRNA pseudouridine1911/1915/1917 synthase
MTELERFVTENRRLRYVLGEHEEGMTLRAVVRNKMQVSRRFAKKLKSFEDGITVNGRRLYMDTKLKAGDVVEVLLPEETSQTIEPQPMAIDVRYEDDYLLAVNKPAGLVVHPTIGHYRNTLANGVMHYWREKGESHRFHPVHRLDEQTSGVVLIAKHAHVHRLMSEQLQRHEVEKVYTAFVHGVIRERRGTITAPIDRDPAHPQLRIVTDDGYPAVTTYEVMRAYAAASKVKIWLGTGRTHQIRVHMQWIGHPLIGDPMYGDERWNDEPYRGVIGRQALHAERLSFVHPMTGERIAIEAPMPDDMRTLEEMLERFSG